LLLAVLYGLTSLAGNAEEELSARRLWLEPAAMFAVFFIFSFIL